jgi:hypothetical protein
VSVSASVSNPWASAALIVSIVGWEFWLSTVKLSRPALSVAAKPSGLLA